MSRKNFCIKSFLSALLIFCMTFMLTFSTSRVSDVYASSEYSFVVLSDYSKTMKIGDSFYLLAIALNGSKPTFSSSNTSVASANTYGKVTAKSAGTATITVKIKNGEASCKIKVEKTIIKLSATSISLENGYSATLQAVVSTGHKVTWKSNKTSVAAIDSNGQILAKKPGTATITATSDKTAVTCKVTVKAPSVKLSKSSAKLYRKQALKLSVSSTSKSTPKWKSNKKSVATVDANGLVTAIKHGTAMITVTVDGVSKTCEIIVEKPTIRFKPDTLTLNKGQVYTPVVTVSSGLTPEFTSSNTNIVTVDANGKIIARQSGKAYIYASEDGTKESLIVTVR